MVAKKRQEKRERGGKEGKKETPHPIGTAPKPETKALAPPPLYTYSSDGITSKLEATYGKKTFILVPSIL
jgi:hypothetical protein